MMRRLLIAFFAVVALSPSAFAEGRTFEIALAKGRPDDAHATLRVKRGEQVELHWITDRPIALHLHGYDIEARVTPESPARMSFVATMAGRFPVSEHGADRSRHRAVLYLEVLP
jgi:hypothetical protein